MRRLDRNEEIVVTCPKCGAKLAVSSSDITNRYTAVCNQCYNGIRVPSNGMSKAFRQEIVRWNQEEYDN